VLERVQELRHQLQSFVRHQQALRDGTRAEHAEMVQEASTTVVQQRVAFLTRIKVSVIQFGGMNVCFNSLFVSLCRRSCPRYIRPISENSRRAANWPLLGTLRSTLKAHIYRGTCSVDGMLKCAYVL
jgi:hypothetical protein